MWAMRPNNTTACYRNYYGYSCPTAIPPTCAGLSQLLRITDQSIRFCDVTVIPEELPPAILLPLLSPSFTDQPSDLLHSLLIPFTNFSGSWVPNKSQDRGKDQRQIYGSRLLNYTKNPIIIKSTYCCEARPQPSAREDQSHMIRSTIINIVLKILNR